MLWTISINWPYVLSSVYNDYSPTSFCSSFWFQSFKKPTVIIPKCTGRSSVPTIKPGALVEGHRGLKAIFRLTLSCEDKTCWSGVRGKKKTLMQGKEVKYIMYLTLAPRKQMLSLWLRTHHPHTSHKGTQGAFWILFGKLESWEKLISLKREERNGERCGDGRRDAVGVWNRARPKKVATSRIWQMDRVQRQRGQRGISASDQPLKTTVTAHFGVTEAKS